MTLDSNEYNNISEVQRYDKNSFKITQLNTRQQ